MEVLFAAQRTNGSLSVGAALAAARQPRSLWRRARRLASAAVGLIGSVTAEGDLDRSFRAGFGHVVRLLLANDPIILQKWKPLEAGPQRERNRRAGRIDDAPAARAL